jgi:hypothetical protein
MMQFDQTINWKDEFHESGQQGKFSVDCGVWRRYQNK